MGLHINSLEHIPIAANRSYFIYLLDYGWHEPLGQALTANYEKMASIAAVNDAVVIKGLDEHFQNEVLSWHNFNGENTEELLPAILIANGHPRKFKESQNDNNLRFVLIPLKKFCRTTTDVASLIDKLFNDIKAQKDVSEFRISREMKKGVGRALVDSIILEPNFAGVGVNIKKIIDYVSKK